MRIRIAREGMLTVDDRVIAAGALQVDNEPVPVLLAFPQGDDSSHDRTQLIGTVESVTRDEDGWLTAEIHTERDLTGYAAEVDIDNVTWSEEDPFVVLKGRLRAVVMGKHPCWDDMVI